MEEASSSNEELQLSEEAMKEALKFKKGDMKHNLVAVTEFKEKFPEGREKYLKQALPIIKEVLKEHGVSVDIDAFAGEISVSTTPATWDPYAIILARDFIRLMCRYVPIEIAGEVFKDEITSEIIQINRMCRNSDTFKKRRNRLVGKENKEIIALQKLTNCSIFVHGNTVAVIGPYKGVKKVLSVVKACMTTVHPLHMLDSLFIQRTYMEDPNMADKDWSRLLPNYKPKTVQKKKKKQQRVPKPFNPLPPPPLESKMDTEMAEGEYFVNKKQQQKAQSIAEQKAKSNAIQKAKRAKQYIPPAERPAKKMRLDQDQSKQVDLQKLNKKVMKQKRKLGEASGIKSRASKE